MGWRKYKLRPSQPFFVFATDKFYQEVYLNRGISHFYTFRTAGSQKIKKVPDGCMDLLFEISEDKVNGFLCGCVLSCSDFWLASGQAEIFGVRFLPGFEPDFFNIKMKELVNKKLPLTRLPCGSALLEAIGRETTFKGRIQTFLQQYISAPKKKPLLFGKKELVIAVKDMAYNSDGKIKISQMSEQSGYSVRYLNRTFIEEMGFPPKRFCKIIQFQRSIELLNYGEPDNMTNAATTLGYYDQPQFIRDFKNYAGLTPRQYLSIALQLDYKAKVVDTHLI